MNIIPPLARLRGIFVAFVALCWVPMPVHAETLWPTTGG
jgi:hypothetical protein